MKKTVLLVLSALLVILGCSAEFKFKSEPEKKNTHILIPSPHEVKQQVSFEPAQLPELQLEPTEPEKIVPIPNYEYNQQYRGEYFKHCPYIHGENSNHYHSQYDSYWLDKSEPVEELPAPQGQ